LSLVLPSYSERTVLFIYLKTTYNILKLAGVILGFKHYYYTIIQRKEINNNPPFSPPESLREEGNKHSNELRYKCVSYSLSSPLNILGIETNKEKFFYSSVQDSNLFDSSELTVCKF